MKKKYLATNFNSFISERNQELSKEETNETDENIEDNIDNQKYNTRNSKNTEKESDIKVDDEENDLGLNDDLIEEYQKYFEKLKSIYKR